MIRIYTFAFNNPEFLEKQYLSFKKHLKQPHLFICINNANDEVNLKAIDDMADRLGVISLSPEGVNHYNAGGSHQQALNWAWKNIMISDDTIIIVDHDMFPIKEFNLHEGYDIAGIMQGRGEHIKYFHPGLMVIHSSVKDREQVNFTGDAIDGLRCDSGGNWHHYLVAHPDIKIKELNLVDVSEEHSWLFPDGTSFERHGHGLQIVGDSVLHFRNGSNWAHVNEGEFNSKKEQFYKIINHHL